MEYADFAEANAARQVEWLSGTTLPLTFRTNELAGEFGEVAELLLDRWTSGSHMHGAWKNALGEEMADVIICAELVAWQLHQRLDYVRAEALAQTPGNDYRWSAQVSRDIGLLCNAAKKMDRTAFGIAGGIGSEEGVAIVMERLDKVVRHIYDFAYGERMYMEVALARKFNKTSAKVKLLTLYIPPGHDRALLIP